MKFGEQLFPKGTFDSQQSDGAYIDDYLAGNLDIYAKKIAKDMHFLGIISGHDAVGNGKTTLLTHVCSYLTWKINQEHGTNNTFTHKNLVFKGDDLANRSFELPKYSVIGLDEGDDLTTHGMKELAVKLKRYFRKCRQLNQILILVLPSFFELPKFYALSRSHFLIDVKFEGEFDRGFFSYYGPRSKKLLYLKGKKEWDYDAARADFQGRFFGSYCFFPDCSGETELYKKQKYKDMVDDHNEYEIKSSHQIELETRNKYYLRFRKNCPEIEQQIVCKGFGFSRFTGHNIEKEQNSTLNEQNNDDFLDD